MTTEPETKRVELTMPELLTLYNDMQPKDERTSLNHDTLFDRLEILRIIRKQIPDDALNPQITIKELEKYSTVELSFTEAQLIKFQTHYKDAQKRFIGSHEMLEIVGSLIKKLTLASIEPEPKEVKRET